MATSALAPAVFQPPASRDRATLLVGALALIALAALPWGLAGGPSALSGAVAGSMSMWWIVAAATATLVFVSLGRDAETAVAAALGFVVILGAGFAAGPAGTPFGFGAAVALLAFTVCFARAI